MSEYILQAIDIQKRFGSNEVLKGISYSARRGEVLSIIGPSGSGKSTFIRCLSRLETINGGKIVIDDEVLADTIDGKVVYPSDREAARICSKTGMVFQSFNLFPHMTVMDNITAAPIRVLKKDREEAEEKARALLLRIGLSDKEKAFPIQLSGGQQQRVAIARALALNPEILFFDEPTSALDPELTGEVLNVIRTLAEDDMTMLIVTHEIGFAKSVSDRILFMDDGVVVEEGPPQQVIDNPTQERTQAFLKRFE